MPALVQSGSLSGTMLAALTVDRRPRAGRPAICTSARTPEPMLPLELWRNRVIVVGSVGNFTSGAMMMGVAAFLPTYIQGAMGRDAIDGGLVLGAMSVSWALASIAAGRIMMRTSYRLVAILGGLAMSVGCAMLTCCVPPTDPSGPPPDRW